MDAESQVRKRNGRDVTVVRTSTGWRIAVDGMVSASDKETAALLEVPLKWLQQFFYVFGMYPVKECAEFESCVIGSIRLLQLLGYAAQQESGRFVRFMRKEKIK